MGNREIAVKYDLVAAAQVAPISETVKLVIEIRPTVIDFAAVMRRCMQPTPGPSVTDYTYHMAITFFNLGIII